MNTIKIDSYKTRQNSDYIRQLALRTRTEDGLMDDLRVNRPYLHGMVKKYLERNK